MDFALHRDVPAPAPVPPRSRLPPSLTPSSFKEPLPLGRHANPYMLPAGLGHATDSRVSLLSMAGVPEDAAEPGLLDSPQLSLKNTKSTRALSSQHAARSSDAGRPRSRTQSSEQGIVTVFSGPQAPPPLDPDLDALNRLPRYRPLVLAPAGSRLSGLFHTGARYIEPTAEQLNLDETELTGLCFSFRDYVCDRAQRVCDRQSEFVCAAKHIGARAAETQARLLAASQQAKHDQDSLSVLKSLQKQTEKSYELIQDILHDLERLEAVLPPDVAGAGGTAAEFPRLSWMFAQRRRSSLQPSSPHASAALRRQIAARKAGAPVFPVRTSSAVPFNYTRSSSTSQSNAPPQAAASSKSRPGPYRLPALARQSSTVVPARSHSKWGSELRALRPRTSRNSLGSSGRSSPSMPPSPTATDEARLSFDGGSIDVQTTNMAALAATDAPRSTPKRPAQPFGSLRPLSMARAVYGDHQGNYSRSEVSLSKEQAVWSPQITTGANDSTFGHGHPADALTQLVLPDVEGGHLRLARHADMSPHDSGGGKQQQQHPPDPSPLSVPTSSDESPGSEARRTSVFRRPRLSVSAVLAASTEAEEAARSLERSPAASMAPLDPSAMLAQARIPPLRPRLSHHAGSPASPGSLHHDLPLQPGPSAASMPSPAPGPVAPTTPLGSPSSPTVTSRTAIVAAGADSGARQENRRSMPPQYPLEAARMLKQMIAERPDAAGSRPASRCSASHALGAAGAHHHRMSHPLGAGTDCSDSGPEHERRSRTSSLAASQLSATEGSDGADQVRQTGTVRTAVDARAASDSVRGLNPWARTNPERMSTWSSSSARTLADGLGGGSRVPSADDPFRQSKRPLSSAALATLTASAAMISRHPRGHGGGDSIGRKGAPGPGAAARIVGPRAAPDLGLSIRTDLEQRVRSYSESGRNPLLPREGRPHSSMGFHETVAGAPVWTVRSDVARARRHSPLSASLRQFHAEKLNPRRPSAMAVASQPRCPGSLSCELRLADDGPQSDATSDRTSCGSGAAAEPPGPAAPDAPARKRRAQTMDHHHE
ncbi:hypothetical protein H4R18_004802 [Coemansia javaensis]|uniref:BLOC-1-related complex subunit 5 n=1 Tax=Coemansia javaensis TaxID=2761396 RepID=A0A9W8H3C9_9FUNG|nr:hypothetical protein H4R18_004802 [Coemansia javaensis]